MKGLSSTRAEGRGLILCPRVAGLPGHEGSRVLVLRLVVDMFKSYITLVMKNLYRSLAVPCNRRNNSRIGREMLDNKKYGKQMRSCALIYSMLRIKVAI